MLKLYQVLIKVILLVTLVVQAIPLATIFIMKFACICSIFIVCISISVYESIITTKTINII
mgnify:CR=1 FL=1